MPLQGVQAKIEVFEEYETALKGIDIFTHLLVIGFLHLSDRTVLQARPRKIDPSAPLRGVFSIRSPVRPNPLSINAVKLLERQGRFITVDRLDLINDTPIIDIKPYVDWDCIFSAHRLPSAHGRILKKFSHEERVQDFLRQAKNFHGSVCPGIAIGVLACAAIFPKYIPISRLKSKKLIVIVESDRCLADAITAITGCTLGRRSLKFKDFGKMAAIFLDQQSNHAFRVALSSRMRKITPESPIDDLLTQPVEEMFSISPVKLHLSEFDLPGYPKAKTICSTCGETVRDQREILQKEIPQCRYCSGIDKYYQQIP
jgi:tRNA-Thr(GGU) m(6)t(6)A37 methyltransferase TsaA